MHSAKVDKEEKQSAEVPKLVGIGFLIHIACIVVVSIATPLEQLQEFHKTLINTIAMDEKLMNESCSIY